jgi:hypothetical protein
MANRKHASPFEATRPTRPRQESSLFSASGNRSSNAVIGNEEIEWDLYCDGYSQAADALVEHFINNHGDNNSLYYHSQAYPILFLYRHYLELRLKELLVAYGHLFGEPAKFDHHGLIALWRRARENHRRSSTESSQEIDADLDVLEEIINQFDQVDLNSESFRYPVRKDGKTVTLPPIQVDLQRLKEAMRWASYVLDGWSVGVDEYIADSH